jgi:putative membrane protein
VLHHLGPFLIALSWPGAAMGAGMRPGLRRWCGRIGRWRVWGLLRQPLLAVVLFEGLLFFWLVPRVTFRAMVDPVLYDVMNASMLLDGLLFWFLVLDPRPAAQAGVGFFVRAVLAFVVIFPQIAAGMLIGIATHDLYPSFSLCGRAFASVGPMLDQQIGGLVLWVPTGMMSALATLIILRRMFEEAG